MVSPALRRRLGAMRTRGASFTFALLFLAIARPSCGADGEDPWISPAALALAPDGKVAYVASATSGEVLFVDLVVGRVSHRVHLAGEPSGLALWADGQALLATSAERRSQLYCIDVPSRSVLWSIPLGHSALCPVLAPDGATAFACNRFNNEISVVDLHLKKETGRIGVEREPVAAALTRDGKHLLVANRLPVGRVDTGVVSAHVSVIEVSSAKVVHQIVLPNGANLLHSLQVSPDGRFACVTHTLARFQLPTSQVERGWMNANALTLIDTSNWSLFTTVLLDCPEKGCANPSGASWTSDGRRLVVAHAGTHELSVIDFPGLLAKVNALPTRTGSKSSALGYVVSQVQSDVPTDLGFLGELRQLIPLKGQGPRPVAIRDDRLCVGDYFTETLEVIDLAQLSREPVEIFLHAPRPRSSEREGEALFNDARLCLQTWQSCASCHSTDARMDGLNWDLLNDGIGNPKNTKSLLRSHQTAPAMSLGVRDSAEAAVRAGIHHILFKMEPEEKARSIDQWLKSLRPAASPHLECGALSPAAERGQKLFLSEETGCAGCHGSQLFTDRRTYDVGTAAETDQPGDLFDTPVLFELWRTAPYLHDGSAATPREVMLDRNRADRHGRTSQLSENQVQDLVAYLLSL